MSTPLDPFFIGDAPETFDEVMDSVPFMRTPGVVAEEIHREERRKKLTATPRCPACGVRDPYDGHDQDGPFCRTMQTIRTERTEW